MDNLFLIIIGTIIATIPFALLMVLFAKINLKYGNNSSRSIFDDDMKNPMTDPNDVVNNPAYSNLSCNVWHRHHD